MGSIHLDTFALAIQNLLYILTHTEFFHFWMEPQPINDSTTAHPTSDSTPDRHDFVNQVRQSMIIPVHRIIGFTIEADSDGDAIDKAKAAAKAAMESAAHPEHVEIGERREGIIAFIDRITTDGRHAVIEDVEFDDDRIHDAPPD
jgi:hypothetical protein